MFRHLRPGTGCVEHIEIDWTPLYAQDRALRVSLPTYPFVRERYWVDVPVAASGATTTPALAVRNPRAVAAAAMVLLKRR